MSADEYDSVPSTDGDVAPPTGVDELKPPSLERALGLNKVLADLFGAETVSERGPEEIGRYQLRRSIGAGGMGRVYEAYDPQLERRIAIKVLHPDLAVDERLLREGKAMARLSHPNVVTVHDVGITDDRAFVAMELVEGTTLRGWQRERRRAWREVLQMYLAVGRGIVAAHEAGLVHCDLKPDNVLVGKDGRPRVTDFGIAQLGTELTGSTGDGTDVSIGAGTMAPAVGTPQYMSPEQFLRRPLDARTDQFAFCSMLWEALFSRRPFKGGSTYELAANVVRGARQDPPPGHGVPPSVRKACERGLAVEPGERWPSMAELLDDLRRAWGRVKRRRAAWAVAGVAMVGAAGIGAVQLRSAQLVQACEEQGAAISEVWNESRREALGEALGSHEAPYAKVTASQVLAVLGARAEAWADATIEVCRHHTVDRSWMRSKYARAQWCLDDRRVELYVVIDQLSHPNDAVMASAIVASKNLASSDTCLDPVRLQQISVPPDESREQVREARHELARSWASYTTGDYEDALVRSTAVYERATELAWAPLVASAALRRAKAAFYLEGNEQGFDYVVDAYFEAARAGELETAFGAALLAESYEGRGSKLGDRRTLWLRHASVLLDQMGAEGDLNHGRHAHALGREAMGRGEHVEARAQLERALEIFGRTLGPRHPTSFQTLRRLAMVDVVDGDFDGGVERLEGLLREQEALYGSEHPALYNTLYDIAAAHIEGGRPKEAQPILERSLALHEATRVPDVDLAIALSNLGGIQNDMRNFDEALRWHARAVAVVDSIDAGDNLLHTMVLNNLANTYLALERYDEARPTLERIVKLLTDNAVAEFPHLAVAQSNLAGALLGQGHVEEARDYFRRSLEIRTRALGEDNPRLGMPLLGLAEAALVAEEPDEIRSAAHQVIALTEDHPQFQGLRHRAQLLLIMAMGFDEPAAAVEQMKAWVARPEVGEDLRERGREWLAEQDSSAR
ncbi:MAG: tetratricopeptide repeat protein [Myxococcota bacterium]